MFAVDESEGEQHSSILAVLYSCQLWWSTSCRGSGIMGRKRRILEPPLLLREFELKGAHQPKSCGVGLGVSRHSTTIVYPFWFKKTRHEVENYVWNLLIHCCSWTGFCPGNMKPHFAIVHTTSLMQHRLFYYIRSMMLVCWLLLLHCEGHPTTSHSSWMMFIFVYIYRLKSNSPSDVSMRTELF